MKRESPVTMAYIGICAVVFAITFAFNVNNPVTLIRFGAKTNFMIADLKLWYLVTPMFLHGSIIHLGLNMVALYYLGPFVEMLLGKTRYILFILLTGTFASMGSFILSNRLSVGASGVVFAFFAVHVFLYINDRYRYKNLFGTSVVSLFVINVFSTFTMPNIDIGGHIFGFISGYALLTFLVKFIPVDKTKRAIALFALIAIVILSVGKGISYKGSEDYFQMKYYYYYQRGNQEKLIEILDEYKKIY